VHLGHRDVEHVGDDRDVRRVDVTQLVLYGVQDRQQRSAQLAQPACDRPHSFDPQRREVRDVDAHTVDSCDLSQDRSKQTS
jgi:hypothetical protein